MKVKFEKNIINGNVNVIATVFSPAIENSFNLFFIIKDNITFLDESALEIPLIFIQQELDFTKKELKKYLKK